VNTYLIWSNLVTYSMQVGLLVGLAAFIPNLLRLRLPSARLAFWQILLVTCLLLPQVRPWKQEMIAGDVEFTTTIVALETPQSQPVQIPWETLGIVVFAGGALCRLGWLGAGFWKLRRLRRQSRPIQGVELAHGVRGVYPALRISDAISSPVTFGFRRPVILLPSRFPELGRSMQDAILAHEMLHVERRDWLITVGEEVVRAIFWFHPAIWWLLGEIQLAREQAVDRAVIELTNSRDEYVDALLAIAGARPQADLALAPLFLRKRHLKQRVVSMLKEARMSRTRLISALAAGVGFLALACWFVTGTFPLAAAPQTDGPGVSIETGGARLLHRGPVFYPESLREKGVQGSVLLDVQIDASGNVSDARVVSGPEELRKTALQSVLQWHFAREGAGSRQVTITFVPTTGVAKSTNISTATPGATPPPPPPPPMPTAAARKSAGMMPPAAPFSGTLRGVNIMGLSDQARGDLLARIPVHEGDVLTEDMAKKIQVIVHEFDEHLNARILPLPNGDTSIIVMAPNSSLQAAAAVAPAPTGAPDRIRVGGNVQQAKLISQTRPAYPPEAKMARIQGVVQLSAVIGKDGTMQRLEVISGHPLLVPAALEAVRQWVYEVTLLNGNPVEVMTQIDINFTLSE
jgi:TonB family protein